MKASATLYRFKNHGQFSLELGQRTVVLWPNGAGKTNLLESLYLAFNAVPPPGRQMADLVQDRSGESFVRLRMENDAGLDPEYVVSFAAEHRRTGLLYQQAPSTRAKYLAAHGYRAMLFLPIEMNLLYLGPSLRRDFLDDTLMLAHEPFARVRREYLQVLRSRNALVKRIRDGEAKSDSLDTWDFLFAAKAAQYMEYRFRLLAFFESRLSVVAESVGKGYPLAVAYDTKVDRAAVSDSLKAYLAAHREKDVLVGHTCIGPHLDDFRFEVALPGGRLPTELYLSRGENKSLLLALKALAVEYVERETGTRTILLLDDMASELDVAHCLALLERFGDRPFVLTGHAVPDAVLALPDVKIVRIG